MIDKCIQSPHLLEDGTWQRIWEILHYRIGSMTLAEIFVRRRQAMNPDAEAVYMGQR